VLSGTVRARGDDPAWDTEQRRLEGLWGRFGFEAFRDGIWVLDPATTTIDDTLSELQAALTRLTDDRDCQQRVAYTRRLSKSRFRRRLGYKMLGRWFVSGRDMAVKRSAWAILGQPPCRLGESVTPTLASDVMARESAARFG
jgi:hypothetical protein